MAPKPASKKSPSRSKSPKKVETTTNPNNDVSLSSIPLNEDSWRGMIAMVVPTEPYEELYIEQLEKTVKNGVRRRFSWLSKKDIIDLINENVGKKAAQASKKPGAAQIPLPHALLATIEACKPHLENKEEIPDNLMAQLIKGKLIHMKAVEKEKEISRAKMAKKPAVIKQPQAKERGKDKSPTGKKSPPKATKKAKEGTLPDIEKQSQLKRKEEIDDEEKYIDDEPKDGANHYIILSGFYSPNLFNLIDEFGIPIDCLIRFKTLNYELVKKFVSEVEERERLESNLKVNLKINNDATDKNSHQLNPEALADQKKAYHEKLKVDLDKFWAEGNSILEKALDKPLIQNIARLKLNLKQDPQIKSWFEIEERAEFSQKMYNELAEKLFSLVVQRRHYSFYINNLKLYALPNPTPVFTYPTSAPQIDSDKFYDMRYYNELMNSIPPEYSSPSIILHCMIEQVVANEEKKSPQSEIDQYKSSSQLNGLSTSVNSHFGVLIESLALDDQDKLHLGHILPIKIEDNPKSFNSSTSSVSPHLVNYNDEIGARLKGAFSEKKEKSHLMKKAEEKKPLFDPMQVEMDMLKKSIWTVFTGLPHVSPKVGKERSARLQELLHFCSSPEITNADVDRAFKQFVFETMNIADVGGKRNYVRIADRNLIIPWDDPYPNISETLSEEQQLLLKTLNTLEAKREIDKQRRIERAPSASSTTKSIKFQDNEFASDSAANLKENLPSSGILKSRSSTKLSVQSVHFPDSYEMNMNEHMNEVTTPKSVEEVVEMINGARKRDLTDWNYAEHYEPKVLVQVLANASHTHPYVDSYYNRRDNSLMLVFSNPHEESALTNHEEWAVKLHSNVGFRNYLEKIYEMIVDWTRDEEAKYQAGLIAKEVGDMFGEVSLESLKDSATAPTAAPRSRSRSSSSKRSPSSEKTKKTKDTKPDFESQTQTTLTIAQTTSDETATTNDDYITDNFVGHNSLKAWKVEHDKQVAQEKSAKDKKKPKSPKGNRKSKSPVGDTAKTPVKGSKKNTTKSPRPSSSSQQRSPSTSRANTPSKGTKSPKRGNSPKNKKSSRSNSKTEIEKPPQEKQENPQKANNQFIGYETGNNMIYVKSHLSHMFPSNGALIKTERHILKSTNKVNITSSVIIDGHTLAIHLTDDTNSSKDSDSKKQSIESARSNPENDTASCFTMVFKNGLSLSYSSQSIAYNPKQSASETESRLGKLNSSLGFNQQTSVEEKERTQQQSVAKKTDRKGKSKKDAHAESTPEIKEEIIPKYVMLPWNQLFLSIPTGLTCTFIPETYSGIQPTMDNQPHRVIIKQSYASKCNEATSDNFKNVNPVIFKESSRLLRSDGTVIKMMNDGSVEIFYANGTVYRKEFEANIEKTGLESMVQIDNLEADLTMRSKHQLSKKKGSDKLDERPMSVDLRHKTKWTVVDPNGDEFLINKEDKTYSLIKHNRFIQSRDIQTGEVMITREDNLKLVYRPDGSTVSEFSDGTRITTFYIESTPLNGESVEREKYVKIECPGFATSIFNAQTSECSVAFGDGTLVSCEPKRVAYTLIHKSGELVEISAGSVSFLPCGSANQISRNRFNFHQTAEIILDHEDETGNRFKVTRTGKNLIMPLNPKPRSQVRQYGKHTPRFFIVHADSSGTEFLRLEDVIDYLTEIEVDPLTAIIRDNIQGYPNILGTTVLRPIKDCQTDQWYYEYDEKDITPIGLRCRNLFNFPSNPEIKVPGGEFASKVGRGLNILEPNAFINIDAALVGSVPQTVSTANRVRNPPLTIAKRMQCRQLIEYQKLNDEIRSKLTLGLKNYINYISQRAENHRLLLTYDPRNELEKLTALKILQISKPDNLEKADVSKLYQETLTKSILANRAEINMSKINKLLVSKNREAKKRELQEELNKEQKNRAAWRHAFVPGYFESEWGHRYLSHKDITNTASEFSQEMFDEKNNRQSDNKESVNTIASGNNFLQTSENDFTALEDNYVENASVSKNNEVNGSKSGKIGDENSNRSFKKQMTKEEYKNLLQSYNPNIQIKNSNSDLVKTETKFRHNTQIDSNRLPKAIKTSRPNAQPNIAFLSTEEPVRRKVHTSIVNAAKLNGRSLEMRRGIEIYPKEVKFGVLREGFTYLADVELVNVGIDLCRFKIKQPPAESGLKIMFKPGPIAAGMNRDLTVMLLAIYRQTEEETSKEICHLKHEIEITTETHIIKLPIEAQIATANEFRNMFRGNLEAGKEKYVRILSVRPGSTKEVLTKPLATNNQNKV